MTMSNRQALARQLAEVEASLDAPRFLWLRPEVLIHDHAPPGSGPCPCCGSRHAAIVERVSLRDLVIDCETGRRALVGAVRPEVWEAVTAEAQAHDLLFRCSRQQAPLLLDDGDQHALVGGGNRSGKTTVGLYWLALQWLRHGGPGRRLWLVASTQAKAHRLLEKLFLGTGESPPILPRALVRSMPATHRASSLLTTLADGTLIDLKYWEGDPGAEKLKSDAIRAALVDEAAHLPGPDSLVALRGRCLDAGGRLLLASTPRPDHFLKEEVVDPAEAFARLPEDDERRRTGEHEGARWRVESFSLLDNPWLDAAVVRRELAALDPEDPAVLRDFFGKWVASAGMLWRDFDVSRHVHLDEARSVADMRATAAQRAGVEQVDATAAVVRRLFQARPSPHFLGIRATNARFILSSDVNCHPMSTVVLQVTADARAPEDRSRWHVWVVDVIQSYQSNSLRHAEKLVDLQWVRAWSPTATASPYKGAGMIVDPTAIQRDPTVHRHGRDPVGLPETLGRLGFDCRPPQYRSTPEGPRVVHLARLDSHTLIHKLLREGRLHIAQRCESLIESFLEQVDSGDGVVPLTKSHTKSDRLASPMDALRYGAWAIFHGGHESGGLPAPGSLPRAA